MKKYVKISLLFVLLVFIVGCAQTTWQAKGTAVFKGAGVTLKQADEAFQNLKAKDLVTSDQIVAYNKIYAKAYESYKLAGEGWKLAMRAGDEVEQKKYMDLFTNHFSDFQDFVAEVVSFVNSILAGEGLKAKKEVK